MVYSAYIGSRCVVCWYFACFLASLGLLVGNLGDLSYFVFLKFSNFFRFFYGSWYLARPGRRYRPVNSSIIIWWLATTTWKCPSRSEKKDYNMELSLRVRLVQFLPRSLDSTFFWTHTCQYSMSSMVLFLLVQALHYICNNLASTHWQIRK